MWVYYTSCSPVLYVSPGQLLIVIVVPMQHSPPKERNSGHGLSARGSRGHYLNTPRFDAEVTSMGSPQLPTNQQTSTCTTNHTRSPHNPSSKQAIKPKLQVFPHHPETAPVHVPVTFIRSRAFIFLESLPMTELYRLKFTLHILLSPGCATIIIRIS